MENEKLEHKLNEIAAALRFQIGTRGVPWVKDLSLKAENFAVSYDYMFVMVQVMEHMNPKNILEFSLGQSSKILARYCDGFYYPCVKYDVIEQNDEWIQFFKSEFDSHNQLERMKIHYIPMIKVKDPEYGTELNQYEDIGDVVRGRKFDFISIDGPFGSERNSRTDILQYIPQCLTESWCIMLDDYGRQGEYDMISKLKGILDGSGIKYRGKEYGVGAEKQFYLICSEDNKFLTTLL